MMIGVLILSLFAAAENPAALAGNPWKTAAAKEVSTPRLLAVSGNAKVKTGREEKFSPAKPGLRLVERADIEVAAGAMVKIQLDPKREVTVFGDTDIGIPGIRWENGEVPLIVIERGRLRWRDAGGGPAVRIQSTLFDLQPGVGDMVFRFSREIPEAELQVIQGAQEFSASNAEDSVVVKDHQHVVFKGALEDGEIAADILLQGKRIPRGKLGPVVKMTDADLAPYLDEEKKAKETARKAEASRRDQADADRKKGLICAAPRGRLNECSWSCEGNPKKSKTCQLDKATCVRRRCNANGVWAEAAELTADDARLRCRSLAAQVGACDY